MNFTITDMLQALNNLTSSMSVVRATLGSKVIDHAYITPTVIAVGDMSDEKVDDAFSLAQGDPCLMWNLSSRPSSSVARLVFLNQVIDCNWRTTCQYTRAPTLNTIFSLCLSIKSWYDLNEKNLSLLHCPTNKPNAGIVIACFLKYIGAFEHAAHAYDFYCGKRLKSDSMHSLSPSYRNLFTNVDKAVDQNGYLNLDPCHLKTINVTGLPVEELPSIEIWDLNGLVFSSHQNFKISSSCTWNSDYGDAFFKISRDIIGDFSLICSFGGQLSSKKDKSTLIFKYQNSTAFLVEEILALQHQDVDINPDYADSLDAELFTIHLMFERYVSSSSHGSSQVQIAKLVPLPSPGLEAFEAGLDEISKSHPVVPDPTQYSELISKGYEDRYIPVALQLANNSGEEARCFIDMMQLRRKQLTFCAESASNRSSIDIKEAALESESDESNWEVVNLKCPICKDENTLQSDQLVPCTSCGSLYHTYCAGLRRIPFGRQTENDRSSREKYIRRHLGDWRCKGCNSSKSILSETYMPKTDGKGIDIPNSSPNSKSKLFQSTTAISIQSLSAVSSGGGVIVTEKLKGGISKSFEPEEFFSIASPEVKKVDSGKSKFLSPFKSKQDNMTGLVALLSSAGMRLEDLAEMPEADQRYTILSILSAKFPDSLIEQLLPFQRSANLDLATALKGILSQLKDSAETNKKLDYVREANDNDSQLIPHHHAESNRDTDNASSKPELLKIGREEEKETFDPRAHMLQVIQRKTGMTNSVASNLESSHSKHTISDGAFCLKQDSTVSKEFTTSVVKDLPEFSKYYKMVKAGIPKHAVAQKLLSDKVVDSAEMAEYLVAANPDEVLSSEYFAKFRIRIKVNQHPKYEKFFKMLSLGILKEAVKQKMQQEGLDPSIIDMDGNEMIPVVNDGGIIAKENKQSGSGIQARTEHASTGKSSEFVVIGDHPKYQKFFKLLKVGLPRDAVKLKMKQEGLDPSMLDKNPDELVSESETNINSSDAQEKDKAAHVRVSEHPKFAKYFQMLKIGLPRGAVQLKMKQDGADPSVLDKDPNDIIPLNEMSKTRTGGAESGKLSLAQHPQYAPFFQMLKQGASLESVKEKAAEAGLNPSLLDKDPNEPMDSQTEEVARVAAIDHPLYGKFFKMLKIGLPLQAVKAKVQQEGLDPSIMDKDPSELIPVNLSKEGKKEAANTAVQAFKVRKKKLYWKALDASKVNSNSLWADETDVALEFDEEEFNQLFVEAASPSHARKISDSTAKEIKKQKVILIDRKRAQNAGIALARIKFTPEDLMTKVMIMDDEGLSMDQLKSMVEFLPSLDEVCILKGFKGDKEQLGQAEKYMVVFMDFPTAAKRMRCMLYRQQFKPRFVECRAKIAKVQNACDDVKLSTRLRKVLKAILKVGNQLNDGEEHKGFTVDSLLKLNSAKAFDKKTSVLQYVISVIHRNDEDCLRFPEDLKHVAEAARLTIDTIMTEKNGLIEEFNGNLRILEDIRSAEESTGNTDAMLDFLVKADGLCKELDKGIDKTREKFSKVLEYFGEDPSMSSQDFFSTLYKFIQEFVLVRDSVQRMLRQQHIQKQQAQQLEAGPKSATKARRFSTLTPQEFGHMGQSQSITQEDSIKAHDSAPLIKSTNNQGSNGGLRKIGNSSAEYHESKAGSSPKDGTSADSPTKKLSRRKSSYM